MGAMMPAGNMNIKDSDAAVLISLGQSNAHGHEQFMQEKDRIAEPLKNVYGLDRRFNQFLDLKHVTWSGFTSHGMNLGETQDDTYCLASEFARLWQDHIDRGNAMGLPDLYIIQISIGAQGVSQCKGEKFNMWYPYREEKLVPGPLGTVDISLFPFTCKILKLAMDDLRANKQNPKVIALHWSGGNDTNVPIAQLTDLETHFRYMFTQFHRAIGQDYPLYVYKQCCVQRMIDQGWPVEGLEYNNGVYGRLVKTMDNMAFISVQDSPFWQDGTLNNGVFADDHVHYTADVQRWFARCQFDAISSNEELM